MFKERVPGLATKKFCCPGTGLQALDSKNTRQLRSSRAVFLAFFLKSREEKERGLGNVCLGKR
jgi:hypothetical protein